MTSPSTSVVVCAYTLDRWDDLRAALASVSGQVPPPDEILLVVDHNERLLDRVIEQVVPHEPRLRVVPNARKQGLSGARNTAVQLVAGDIVVFLDDDAAAEPGWLSGLLRHYRNDDVIGVGGAAEPRWPQGQHRPANLPAADPALRGELDWVVGCTYAGQPTSASVIRNLMGCNMSFRREVFHRVAGFSEDLGRVGRTPLGCEETELCIRASGAFPGSRIIFEPSALVQHQVSLDRLSWSYLRRRCYAEGVSKAAVSRMVGSGQALSTERGYAVSVLPRGVARQLSRAVRSDHRGTALQGAAAIVLALAASVVGYLRARSSGARVGTGSAPMLDVG